MSVQLAMQEVQWLNGLKMLEKICALAVSVLAKRDGVSSHRLP